MTGVGLESLPPKWLVTKTSSLDHSAVLPVCCVVNSIHDVSRYHLQVFKIHERILCIRMPIVLMMTENTCAGVQNKGQNTLYRNVNKMKGVGLRPTQPK